MFTFYAEGNEWFINKLLTNQLNFWASIEKERNYYKQHATQPQIPFSLHVTVSFHAGIQCKILFKVISLPIPSSINFNMSKL